MWYSSEQLVDLIAELFWYRLKDKPASIDIDDEGRKQFNALLTDQVAHKLLIETLEKLTDAFTLTASQEEPLTQFTAAIRKTLIGMAAEAADNPDLLSDSFVLKQG